MASTIRGDDNFDSAGPFGSLEFLTETSITSTASYIQYTFPSGYRGFQFTLNSWTNDRSNGDTEEIRYRLTDGSNALITAGEYATSTWNELTPGQNDYWVGPRISGNVTPSYGKIIFLEVMYPLQTDKNTSFITYGSGYESRDGGAYRSSRTQFGGMKVPEANNAIRFYCGYGVSIDATSQSYSVWGIK